MLPDLIHFLPVLAQTSESSTDFQGELIRLIAFICVLTILWLGVMYLLFRRTTERRRRQREGLPPLPGLHVSLMQWLSGKPKPAFQDDAHMPDLEMLTGDLPQPDLAAMMGDFEPPEPEPAQVDLASAFELPPEPIPAQEFDDSAPLAASFAPDAVQSIQLDETEVSDEMPAPPDSIELLRVWRDLSDGSLIIEIGGQRFTSVDQLQGANLDRRFMNVVRDLTNMLRAPQQPPPASQPPKPAPPPPSAAKSPEGPAQPAKKSPSPDEDLPSMAPGTMFRQIGRAAMGYKPEPVEETPALSIPDQIEQVLQKHLVDRPEFAGRSIHVRPSPFGGVRIEVDGQFFEGVGDVSDDEVRALIQDAVREWETGQ
jgi:hypothetical protein